MSEATVERRLVPDRLDQPLWRRLMRWETLLAAIAIAVFGLNSVASPYFLDPWALSDLTFTFTEKGLIARRVRPLRRCDHGAGFHAHGYGG
jgi:hypothetical protein